MYHGGEQSGVEDWLHEVVSFWALMDLLRSPRTNVFHHLQFPLPIANPNNWRESAMYISGIYPNARHWFDLDTRAVDAPQDEITTNFWRNVGRVLPVFRTARVSEYKIMSTGLPPCDDI